MLQTILAAGVVTCYAVSAVICTLIGAVIGAVLRADTAAVRMENTFVYSAVGFCSSPIAVILFAFVLFPFAH